VTEATPRPWYLWPTHWAGGSSSVQVDGNNTVWIDSPNGEVCRLKPSDGGRIDGKVYANAELIVTAVNSYDPFREALEAIGKVGCVFDFSGDPNNDAPRFPETCASNAHTCSACIANAALRRVKKEVPIA